MPNALNLAVTPSALPAGFCLTSYQQLLNDFSSHQSVTFPDTFKGVIVSPTKPGVNDTDKVWQKVDALGRPIRLYAFAQGAWLSPHPVYPGMVNIWAAPLPADILSTFDEGNNAGLSPTSGVMWEEVVELRAKLPVGAGTLPSGTVLAQGTNAGAETVLLTGAHVPPHTHGIPVTDVNQGAGNALLVDSQHRALVDTLQTLPSAEINDATASFSIIPPVYVVYFLRKTIRRWYVEP